MINLPGDSADYHLLTKGIELSKDVPGMTCEIGLRQGGGTKFIIDAIAQYCPGKTHIAIDPYGSILYELKENHFVRLDYTNEMRDECLKNVYAYCQEKKVNFLFFNLTDLDFFERYQHGIPIYDIERRVEKKYSFVFFDGPHSLLAIMFELLFFMDRITKGACFVFDDVSTTDVYYDHKVIHSYLLSIGFSLIVNTDKKALYQYEGWGAGMRVGDELNLLPRRKIIK